ncbi:hypothetical protein Q5692_21480 [Microcoleus sp. C2C3]
MRFLDIAEGRRKFGNEQCTGCNGCNGCNGCQEEGRSNNSNGFSD